LKNLRHLYDPCVFFIADWVVKWSINENHGGRWLKEKVRNYAFLFGVAAVIIFLDQWTKMLVRTRLTLGETWAPWEWLAPYVHVVHWTNSGVAFGMFQNTGMIFAVVSAVVALAIIYYYPQIPVREWALRLGLGIILGGAVGNLIDRLRFNGSVTDFLSIRYFAVINLADASITVGVAILLLATWIKERQLKRDADAR